MKNNLIFFKDDLSCIIRSNELVKDGFSLDHSKCFTVFSASNYYESNNMGAILKLNANETALEPYVYNNNYNKTSASSFSIQDQFKHLIQLNKRDLCAKFEIRDKIKTGSLKLDQFSNVIHEYFGEFNMLQIKELFPNEYDQETNKFHYSNLFSSIQHESSRHLNKILVNIFNMLDIDDDKRVSLIELKEALGFVRNTDVESNLNYNNVYQSIVEQLDKTSSNSNEICLNDFKKAISHVLEVDLIMNNLNLGGDDRDEEQDESCKEFVISSENGNDDISDGDVDDEEDENGEEKDESGDEDENENENDDSKSMDSESSEDGPLQLVRL